MIRIITMKMSLDLQLAFDKYPLKPRSTLTCWNFLFLSNDRLGGHNYGYIVITDEIMMNEICF